MKTLSRTGAMAGAATLFITVTVATAAHAASVTVPAEGSLLADGAGVSLSITVDCDAGRTADLFVNVAQNVDGQHAATGSTISDTVTCADGTETVEVALLVAGDYAFTDGDALVDILLFTCDAETCDSVTATGVAQFVRP